MILFMEFFRRQLRKFLRKFLFRAPDPFAADLLQGFEGVEQGGIASHQDASPSTR